MLPRGAHRLLLVEAVSQGEAALLVRLRDNVLRRELPGALARLAHERRQPADDASGRKGVKVRVTERGLRGLLVQNILRRMRVSRGTNGTPYTYHLLSVVYTLCALRITIKTHGTLPAIRTK